MAVCKQQVIEAHRSDPARTAADIAALLGCHDAYVRGTAQRNGLTLGKRPRSKLTRKRWHPIATLHHDRYVLGWSERSDGCAERSYFLGRRYDTRAGRLINEWTGRWREVSHWSPLPRGPAA